MEGKPLEEKPSFWKRLKTNNKVEFLARGTDSHVYKVENYRSRTVAKEYDKLQLRFGKEETKKILDNYYLDTERAKKLLQEDPNPLKQFITIDGVEYSFHYTIVPQGELMVGKYAQDYPNAEEVPLVIGQNFQEGLNFDDLRNSQIDKSKLKQIRDDQKLFYHSSAYKKDIRYNCEEVFEYLNKKLEKEFTFATVNIKPYLNTKERKIEIAITDLASSLTVYHASLAIRKYEAGE